MQQNNKQTPKNKNPNQKNIEKKNEQTKQKQLVDKKEVKIGDTVKVSIKASDDMSGINDDYGLKIWYNMPKTNKIKTIYIVIIMCKVISLKNSPTTERSAPDNPVLR